MTNFRVIQTLFFLALAHTLSAQAPPAAKWWVEFTDKNNSPYCICEPAVFLSARALERRARSGIAVVENDLPVNPDYVRELQLKGARIHHTSRWLNAATVIADSAAVRALAGLPFVRTVEYLGPDIRIKNPPNRLPKKRQMLSESPKIDGAKTTFGYAGLQNSLLGISLLQAAGHRGAGIWVAVLDGGFTNVDTLPFFDSIALQGRLFQGWDFVERDGAVFESAAHGTSVLSVMASNLPGYFVGTAPAATYFLVKTEDTGGEFPVEEANWIAGVEWADSLGVDIINASLGYTTFNDSTLNHRFVHLDGRTAIGSRGATIAASKGMIICNSAGNSGDEPWKHIGVPADAPGVVAVGATTHEGAHASFSSIGPTSDGRIKPDLVAPGDMVVVAGDSGVDLGLSSGTSLASPILAGALASLWSAFPEKASDEILSAVFRSADQAGTPDNTRGYGLPNMADAWLDLGGFIDGNTPNNARGGLFSFDRASRKFSFLLFPSTTSGRPEVEVRRLTGEKVAIRSLHWRPAGICTLEIGLEETPEPGFYQILVYSETGVIRLAGLAW